MDSYRRRHNTGMLRTLIVIAIVYDAVLYYRHRLTGALTLDGAIGVLLGLFICSRGAANLLDLILFGRLIQQQAPSKRSQASWVALNVLVLLIGWSAIVVGAVQLTGATPAGVISPAPR